MTENAKKPEPWENRFQQYCEARRIDRENVPNTWMAVREAFQVGYQSTGVEKLQQWEEDLDRAWDVMKETK